MVCEVIDSMEGSLLGRNATRATDFGSPDHAAILQELRFDHKKGLMRPLRQSVLGDPSSNGHCP
jgi:hypothetical protein